MAEDAKAKDEDAAPPGAGPLGVDRPQSLQGATAPPREKAVIEGEALRSEVHASPTEEGQRASDEAPKGAAEIASPNGAAARPTAALAAPVQVGQAETNAGKNSAPPRRARASLLPLAAAIVIGALIAVGGAFGLHSLNEAPKSLAVLEQRIAALEHRRQPSAPRQAAHALDERISGLESGAHTMAATLAGLQQSVQHLEAAQKQLEATQAAQKIAIAKPAPGAKPVDLAPLSQRVGKFEGALASLDQRIRDLATKFAVQIHTAQAVKDRAATRAEADAVAIIAANLRREAAAGAAFADDLSALANHGFDKRKLAVLAPVAATGVATPAMLAKQFSALARDIIATEPEPKGEGFLGRLAHDAAHLVRIRKIGDKKGHDLAAQVARIKAALASGAVETALQEWNGLPADAKTKSAAFGAAAQRRLDALRMAKAIEADALAALAKLKS